MMARDFKLSMSLNLKDNASKLLASLLKEGTKQASEAEKAAKRQSEEQQKSTKAAISLERTRAAELRRNAKAREALGVSSEQSVQREIDRTIAAYNRLTRAGVMSATEQSRAFNQMRSRVAALRSELQGVTRLERARQTGRNVMTIAGGVAAAGAALVQPIRKQMSYSERLTEMTNTAFSDQDIAGRTAGMQRLDKMIRKNVQSSGLSKEGVMDAANELLANGLSEKEVNALLPSITRSASAGKTDPVQLAKIATSALQSFKIPKEQMGRVMDMILAAGQAGGFEQSDMAKWLPAQMAAGSNIGMSGLDGLKKILGLNEVSVTTAGSKDEAGNNVVNLLAKIGSQDAARAAARIKVNGKGIDLPGTLAKARENGMDPLQAFAGVINKVVSQDKRYQKLQNELEKLPKGDKAGRDKTLDAMLAILKGAGLGKIVADRQALMALTAYMNGGDYLKRVNAEIEKQQNLKPGEKSATDLNFEFNSQQPWHKADQAKNAWDFAQMDAVKGPAHLVGTFAGGLADAAEKFPGLATAVAGATTAIQAMTQAALAFAGLKFLTEGLGGLVGKVGTAAEGGALVSKVGNAVTGGEKTLSHAAGTTGRGFLGRILGKVFAPLALYEGAEDAPIVQVERARDKRARVEAAGYKLPEGFSSPGLLDVWDEWHTPSPSRETIAPSQVLSVTDPRRYNSGLGGNQYPGQPQKIELNNKTVLEVDGQTLAEVVNRYNVQDAARGTGAGGGQ
ncbi:phage tail tape measure protein [Salmonella enterica]|uniref:phage tail tape measure protein n=1 Tax=Salmonella bongori TaxID=54736 RepID=UPI000A28111D|nr:phage tail tape measure protein [Salmonella bongori]EAA5542245.1 phage tail tape measure protein [Salmonella enterica subsp. enterica serovar Abony]ECB6674251.1 phage tail tape measure protein [Salmonella enterica subsp. enterica serovar Kottbus]ECZ0089428.1 phage tail tape measure protein [Salmonella enterica subsp. enterica serovar Miami]EEH0118615.1 phage tail tape measure protein [Salmonella enterica]EGL1304414.1 phage tail tape measure protein [Salmonella enterica]